jgi:hypothetical protein
MKTALGLREQLTKSNAHLARREVNASSLNQINNFAAYTKTLKSAINEGVCSQYLGAQSNQ